MIDTTLNVPAVALEDTLAFLRRAGERHSEGVVLWLGRRTASAIKIEEAYVPDQEADCDYFRIPPHATAALLRHLGTTGTFVAAQVHSHPCEAFHSEADNMWAIVRHLGALSLVVPSFARGTSVHNFVKEIAAFRLSATNVWEELDPADREDSIRIV